MIRKIALTLGLMIAATLAQAQELRMPFPVLTTIDEPSVFDSYALPSGIWDKTGLPTRRFEGDITRRAWHLDAPQVSLLEIIAPLRDQLVAQGYQLVLDCEARSCGGFDFRFATEVMAEPAMFVDLGDYRFLSATKGATAVSLMVSRSASIGYVQMIHVGPEPLLPLAPQSLSHQPVSEQEGLIQRLDKGLPAPIEGIIFASNSRKIDGDRRDLEALAAWLKAHETRKVMLVGHTDISGSLAGNIAVSKQRAEALRQELISKYGIAAARLTAEGVGPLAPRAAHTAEGASLNRRVEVVPLP